MQDLQAAAEIIESQLQLANSLAWEIDWNAYNGFIVEDGTVDAAYIEESMVTAYNNALENVRNASYLTAQDILIEEHNIAINNVHTAIDNLVDATAVLQTVSVVAELAAEANTTEEQLQVQVAITNTDMSIDQQDVDNFNNALTDIQTFAQQAAAMDTRLSANGLKNRLSFGYANLHGTDASALNFVTVVEDTEVVTDLGFSLGHSNYTGTMGRVSVGFSW